MGVIEQLPLEAPAVRLSEKAPVMSGSNDVTSMMYVPVAGSVNRPEPAGMREFVPFVPPPPSSLEVTLPPGRTRLRNVSKADDCTRIATGWPPVPANE